MHGLGKGGKVKSKANSRSSHTGITFSVGCIHRLLRKGNYAVIVGDGAPVSWATVMEYLTAEVLELVDNAARGNKKTCIIPRHLQLVIRNNEELNKLLHDRERWCVTKYSSNSITQEDRQEMLFFFEC